MTGGFDLGAGDLIRYDYLWKEMAAIMKGQSTTWLGSCRAGDCPRNTSENH